MIEVHYTLLGLTTRVQSTVSEHSCGCGYFHDLACRKNSNRNIIMSGLQPGRGKTGIFSLICTLGAIRVAFIGGYLPHRVTLLQSLHCT